MFKYLLLILLAGLVWWLWRKGRRAAENPPSSEIRLDAPVERMVVCAACGVHLPQSDSILHDGRHFCCEEHRQTGAQSRP